MSGNFETCNALLSQVQAHLKSEDDEKKEGEGQEEEQKVQEQ